MLILITIARATHGLTANIFNAPHIYLNIRCDVIRKNILGNKQGLSPYACSQ